MQLQLIRSATLRFDYAGHRFIIDPYLAARYSRPPYAGKSRNPLVELPFPPNEVLAGMEMVIVSHLHSDHFDPVAQEILPRGMLLFCQPEDQASLRGMGFTNIDPISDVVLWDGITITRTHCQHGSGAVLEEMGVASGFLFSAPSEPKIYWAGDTILYHGVAEVIEREQPDIIITHSCGAMWGDGVLILMDAAQTIEVCKAAGNGVVIATHMDAVDHATVTRIDLRRYAEDHGIGRDQLIIPEDGETLSFS
jgi:L-ascorbate metabolism protein UlaG (beta-lactamase superfamily)